MKKIILLLIAAACALPAMPQSTWRQGRHGIVFGGGCNIFMGDLGGGYKNGTHIFALDDVDPHFLNMTAMLGYSLRLGSRLSCRASLTFSKVSADDADSKNESRRGRNLNFRSRLFDIGATLDYYFIRETTGRLEPGSLKGRLSGYFFTGIGLVKFNPMGRSGSQWYELQPLCTEGQGSGCRFVAQTSSGSRVVEAGSPYKLAAAAIPIGVGFKVCMASDIAIGLELAQRFTTSDYIDDCSAYYFNYASEGVAPPSEMTSAFASKGPGPAPATGTKRGNPDYNDSYFTAMFTVYYTLFAKGGGAQQ